MSETTTFLYRGIIERLQYKGKHDKDCSFIVVELLAQWGLILKKGTIVDSTFIESSSSAKN